jgi:outer membrane protein OmpA-like peptidoglycan-associated protein
MKIKTLSAAPLAAIAIAIAGCAGMEPNPSLEEARNAVQNAAADPLVVESAAPELDRAREALSRADAIYNEDGNGEPERLEHESYLAGRYAQTAMAIADEARASDAIESAEAERNRVLLEIRTEQADARAVEAEAARVAAARNAQGAELALRQANVERQRAAAAQSQARALAEQLQNLEAQRTDRGIVLTLGDVLFDVDEASLKPGAASTITQLAEFLNEYPERSLVIEGHTDNTGPDAYNEDLSERRANALAMALEQRGVTGSRLVTRGLGESQPVASNETAAGRQQNRRVEVVVADE